MTTPAETPAKFYILKTNGIANIRSINIALSKCPEVPTFWMPGYMVPKKLRNSEVLRKQFLYFDYAFVSLKDPIAFEDFLKERKIPAYLLHIPDPYKKIPMPLTAEEIQRVKDLEKFKQLEVEQFKQPGLKIGTLIEVCNGPFIGCKGVILSLHAKHAVLEMNVFGRPTRVNVGNEFLTNVMQPYENVDNTIDDEQ